VNGRLRRWRNCVQDDAVLGREHGVARRLIGADHRKQSADVGAGHASFAERPAARYDENIPPPRWMMTPPPNSERPSALSWEHRAFPLTFSSWVVSR
jgi:hypothetical protein